MTGRGVATDVVEASARAYLNAVNKLVRSCAASAARRRSANVALVGGRDRPPLGPDAARRARRSARRVGDRMSVNLWRMRACARVSARAGHDPASGRRARSVVELLPARVERVLDLGTGDGSTLALVLAARPGATGRRARLRGRDAAAGARALRRRRAGRDRAARSRRAVAVGARARSISSCQLRDPPLAPARQRALYGEVFECLRPGGRVRQRRARGLADRRSCTTQFLAALGGRPDDDDPSNQLVAVARPSDLARRARIRRTSNVFGSGGSLPLLQGTSRPI